MAQSGIPLGQWSGSDATKGLEETIKRIQMENSKQQTTMLRWTQACGVFAFLAFVVSLAALVVSLVH
jgi:hypothetical protein